MSNTGRIIKDYLDLSIATLLVAIAVVFYMEPCHIITGSVSGLGILLSDITALNASFIVLLLNLFCYLAGVVFLGKNFAIRSLYVSVLLPVLMYGLKQLPYAFQAGNILIDTVLFLVFLSSGQAILFKAECSSGGLDTIAEILGRFLKSSTGMMIGLLGVLVGLLCISVYGLQAAIMGIVVTISNGLILDLIMNRDQVYQRLMLFRAHS